MTNAMMNPMGRAPMIRVLPPCSRPELAARRRARRRRALWNTILEALATLGLGAAMFLCAVMILCVA